MRQDKRQTAIVIPGFWLPIIAAFLVWLKFFSVDFAAAGVLNWPVFGVEEALGPLRHVVRAAAVAPPSLAAVLCIKLYNSISRRPRSRKKVEHGKWFIFK